MGALGNLVLLDLGNARATTSNTHPDAHTITHANAPHTTSDTPYTTAPHSASDTPQATYTYTGTSTRGVTMFLWCDMDARGIPLGNV